MPTPVIGFMNLINLTLMPRPNDPHAWFPHMVMICMEGDENGEITEVYPAKTNYRGFSKESNNQGYAKVESYMRKFVEKK
jgi:hypothetical protein